MEKPHDTVIHVEDLWAVIDLALSVEIHVLADRIVIDVKRASPF